MKGPVCDFLLTCVLAADPGGWADLDYRAALYAVQARPVDPVDAEAAADAALVEALALVTRSDSRTPSGARTRLLLAHAAQQAQLPEVAEAALAPIAADPPAVLSGPIALLRARASHAHQNWSTLASQLADVRALDLPAEVHAELDFMRAEAATATGHFSDAETLIIDRIPATDSRRAYALFNLGVALRNAGLLDDADRVLHVLVRSDVFAADALDVKQRGRLALALLQQQRTETASAEAQLRDLPAEGRYRAAALASYASLAMEDDEYELAARIWLTLRRDDPASAAGQTAALAYPICLEQLDSAPATLDAFRSAERAFVDRRAVLDHVRTLAADTHWTTALLRATAGDRWPTERDPELLLWLELLGRSDWLAWSERETVQQIVSSWRLLNRARGRLDRVPTDVAALAAIGRERGLRAARAAEALERTIPHRTAALRARWDDVHRRAEALARARPQRSREWMQPLAEPVEQRTLETLAALREHAEKLPVSAQRDALLERIDRLDAVVFFAVVQRASDAATRVLESHDVTATLARIDSRTHALAGSRRAIAAAAGADLGVFAERASREATRVDLLLGRVASTFRSVIAAEIDRQIGIAEHQLRLTRIGLARATDRVAVGSGEAPR